LNGQAVGHGESVLALIAVMTGNARAW